MQLKIQHSNWGILSNRKIVIRSYSLGSLLFCEIDTSNGFLISSSIRQVLHQLLIPQLSFVSLLGSDSGFENVTQLADTEK